MWCGTEGGGGGGGETGGGGGVKVDVDNRHISVWASRSTFQFFVASSLNL